MSEPITFRGIIYAARVDRDGAWRLTLEVSAQDGPKIAALALVTEQVFIVSCKSET